MAVVSLTIGVHSGGEKLAEEVAHELGARCASREVLLEAAKTFNVPEAKISQVFERTPSFWERMTESRRTFLAYIQATLADWAREDRLVYHGNAGQEILREVPHVLRVRIDVPLRKRVRIAMEAMGTNEEQARRYIEQADDDRAKRLRYFYNADWKDNSLYDLVIGGDKLTLDDAKELILSTVKRPQFQLTPDKEGPFRDYLLKSRIYALLAGALVGRLSLIGVTVQDGVVTLSGTITSHESVLDHIVRQIEAISGVKQVRNEIVVGMVYHEWNV
jgi:cytidylate kinase